MINSQITWVYCSLFLTNNCMNTLLKDTVVMFAGIFLIFFCSWLYFINNGSFVGLFCCQNHIRPTAHTHFMSLSQFDNSHHILNSYYICLVIRDQCNFPVTTVSILRNHSIDGKLKKIKCDFLLFPYFPLLSTPLLLRQHDNEIGSTVYNWKKLYASWLKFRARNN